MLDNQSGSIFDILRFVFVKTSGVNMILEFSEVYIYIILYSPVFIKQLLSHPVNLNISRLGRENGCYKKLQRIAVINGRLCIRVLFLQKSPDSVEVVSVVRDVIFLQRVLCIRFFCFFSGMSDSRFIRFIFRFQPW